jgi:hypothetical protein
MSREEVNKLNKQHELEISNMLERLNLTRDSNIQKLKQDLKSGSSGGQPIASRNQV